MEWFEEPNLAQTFYEMIQADQDLEILKQKLALKTDFNLHDVWAIFDTQGCGTISRMQFAEVYSLFGLFPEREELIMGFRKYDSDSDDLLKYEDIIKMFGPRDKRYCDVLTARKPFNDGLCFMRAKCFLPDTLTDFSRLLLLILNTEARINSLKKSLL